MDNKDVLDLDALVPQPRTIKFEEKMIEVKPPSTQDVLRLGALGQKMSTADTMDGNALTELITQINEQVVICIPELKDKVLGANQLLKLVTLISDMGIPNEAKALKEQGITTDEGK